MHTVIKSKRQIQSTQREFLDRLFASLPRVDGQFTIGHQGSNFNLDDLRSNGIVWFGHFKDDNAKVPRFWNGFGLSIELTISGSNSIITEANVSLDGNHPKAKSVAAFFAKDERGKKVLIHTGKVGGGKKGVGKTAFLDWYDGKLCEFTYNAGSLDIENGIVIADLGQENIAQTISNFVQSVALFKSEVAASDESNLTDDELKKKAKAAQKKPKSSTTVSITFSRSQHVASYSKKRANGRCDLCRDAAPFNDCSGLPYLECHHIVWLAHGGTDSIENTVALCPNCHKKMHILAKNEDIEKLKKMALRAI